MRSGSFFICIYMHLFFSIFLVISFFVISFFHFHLHSARSGGPLVAYVFRWWSLSQEFLVELFKTLPGVPSSRMSAGECQDVTTLAPSPPTSPSASTPLGMAPSPMLELRYNTTAEEVSSGPSYVIFCYVNFWPLLATSGLLCSLLSILHPGISLTCAGCLSALLQACSSNTTSATTSPCSTPRSVLWQGGLTREPLEKEGTQGDAQTTQEWWGERQMGDGLAFQDVSPPVGWRERRKVEKEEEEEKEEEKEVEVGEEEGLVEGVGEEEAEVAILTTTKHNS